MVVGFARAKCGVNWLSSGVHESSADNRGLETRLTNRSALRSCLLRAAVVLMEGRRTFLTFGQCGHQRTDALPVSQLSLSIDLESGPISVSA